jgi:hypothetical protein
MRAQCLQVAMMVWLATTPLQNWGRENISVRRREKSSTPKAAHLNEERFGEAQGRPLLTHGKSFVTRKIEVSAHNDKEQNEARIAAIPHQYLIRVQEAKKSMVHAKLVQISSYVQYLAYDTFQIITTRSGIQKVFEIDGVVAAYDFPTTLKLSEELVSSDQNSESMTESKGSPKMRGNNRESVPVTINVLIAGNIQGESFDALCGEEDARISVCSVREVTSGKKLAIDTDEKSLPAILQHCAAHPLVIWVEERKVLRTFNKYASRIVQGQGRQQNSSQHPFWERGLTGKGEIIGEETIHSVF